MLTPEFFFWEGYTFYKVIILNMTNMMVIVLHLASAITVDGLI